MSLRAPIGKLAITTTGVVFAAAFVLGVASTAIAGPPEGVVLPALRQAPGLPVGSLVVRQAFPDHPSGPPAGGGGAPPGVEAAGDHCDKTVDLTSTLSGVTSTAALDTTICSNADIDTYERDGRTYVILAGGDEAAWTHIEVTDPANPVILGQFFWNDRPAQTTYTPDLKTFRIGTSDYIALALERLTILAFCGVVIYDVSDPADPQFVSQYIGDTDAQDLGPF